MRTESRWVRMPDGTKKLRSQLEAEHAAPPPPPEIKEDEELSSESEFSIPTDPEEAD